MASLYKMRGRDTFYLSYRINNKNKVINTNIPVNKKSLAEAFKKEFEAKLLLLTKAKDTSKRESNNYSDKNVTLDNAINDFIQTYKVMWSKGRASNIQTVLKQLKDFLKPGIIVSEVNTQNLSDFIIHRKKKITITTLRSDLQIIRTFFNHLIEESIIVKSPINKKLIPKPVIKNISVMTDKDLNQIFEKTKSNDRTFFRYLKLLSLTGARPGDILRLKFSDIDMRTGVIRIAISKTQRDIDFPIYDELKTFIESEIKDINDSSNDKIFKEFKSHTLGRKFARLKKVLNLKSEFNLKTFRKTFATKLINSRVDGAIVAHLLGHTSVNTTSKYYIKKNTSSIKNILNEVS